MSGENFIAQFLVEQRARGRTSGLLDGLFAHLAPVPSPAAPTAVIPNPARPTAPTRTVQDFTAERHAKRAQRPETAKPQSPFAYLVALIGSRAPAESWPLGHAEPPLPALAPRRTPPSPDVPNVGRLIPQSAPDAPMRTIYDFNEALEQARAQRHSIQQEQIKITYKPAESLTACMDSADCPATARKIFRVLHELALEAARVNGQQIKASVGVFHLPLELLAAHIERDRTTVWRNLQTLLASGVVTAADHYGTLRGQNVVSGKVWAVSLTPERVLSGDAAPVRLTMRDLNHEWRDMDKDARSGRTAYAITRTEGRQAAEKARREAKADEKAQADQRAAERLAARAQARANGEVVPRGRAAATLNAATTRAENPRPAPGNREMQQSLERLKTIEKKELTSWVLSGFLDKGSDVTLTVAPGSKTVLDAIFTLPTLTGLSVSRRNELVGQTARTLAAGFEDGENFKFWCWLIWQTIRASDQGQSVTDDVLHIMLRVWHDLQQDKSMGNRAQNRPAALVVNELRNCGLYEELKATAPTRVGKRPRAA